MLAQNHVSKMAQWSFRSSSMPPRQILPQHQVKRHMSVQSSGNDGDLLTNIEEDVKSKQEKEPTGSKGFGKPTPKPKKKQEPKSEKERIYEQAGMKPYDTQLNREMNTGDKIEETIVRALAFLFIVFFAEGIFLAIAGFLPEAWDDFAINYVYPAFTPTLGLFLAISIIYGLLKTRQNAK